MTSSLQIRRVDDASVTTLHLEGVVDTDASSVLRWDHLTDLKPCVRFHLRKVLRIDSCGTREWIRFVMSAPQGKVIEYEQCSVAFVQQMNRIANFLGRGKVRSFFVPVFCPQCHFATEQLMLAGSISKEDLETTGECPYCKVGLELDDLPETFEAFCLPDQDEQQPSRDRLITLLHYLYDAATICTLLVDDWGRIQYANRALGHLLGHNPKQLVGAALAETADLTVGGEPLPIGVDEVPEPRNWRDVHIRQLPNRELLAEVVPFPSIGASLLRLVELSAEAAVQRKYKELWADEQVARQELAERNKSLQEKNRELVETKSKLSDAVERLQETQAKMLLTERLTALGHLSASLAHELNNPMNYVLTNLVDLEDRSAKLESLSSEIDRTAADERLASKLRDPAVRDALKQAPELVRDTLVGTRLVVRLLGNLKQFMHPGRQSREATDLHEAIDVALRLVEPQLRDRVQVVRDFGPVFPIDGDRSQLIHLFVALFVNAHQAFEAGQFDARLRVVTMQRGDEAVAVVADNGPGMDEETRERVFEPFFTTKPAGQGTGLGLSLVRQVAEGFGGSVQLDSAPGAGTEIHVRFPVTESSDSSESEYDPPVRSAAPKGTASSARVLIFEDDVFVGRGLSRFLGRRYEVSVVDDPTEGLERLRSGAAVDAILIDLMMPKMSGAEVVSWIERQRPELRSCICLFTGGATSAESHELISSRRYPVLYKPIEPDVVMRVLHELTTGTD